MNKNLTIHGETLAASQEGMLAAEQFLQEHYFFRRNVLSGKVEFAVVPSEGEPQYRVLTQEAVIGPRRWSFHNPGRQSA